MKSISEILSDVIRASGFTPDALCSAGRCYDFANTAIRILEKNGHSAQLMTSDSYIQSKGDKIGWVEESVLLENPHAWVYSDGKHYDALDLEGVMKPLDMKFFKSQIMSYHYPDREERAYRLQNFGEVYSRELDKFVKKDVVKENFSGVINYAIPDFDKEWEEAIRYPEFRNLGKENWIRLASKGKAVTVTAKTVSKINNTDAADPNMFVKLETQKKRRVLSQLLSGNIEMPIVARYSDGYLELLAGNTRLTALMTKYQKAKVWLFDVPEELNENFSDGKKPGRKGLAKRMGVDCTKSVSELRKIAKKSTGEKQRMAHWCANMKAGRQRSNESSQLTENYNSMSEEEQISWVSRRPDRIKFITDPTERVQLAAVEIDENVIHWIANPTERVQLIAIKYDPFLLYSIRNSTKQIQMIAVRENGILIVGPKNLDPSIFEDRQVKRAVLKAILENLEDDELVDMIYAVLENHQVKWPELDKITAVRYRTPIAESRDLNSMSEEEQIRAVQENPGMLYEIDKPSERVQIAAVLNDYAAISYIKPHLRSPAAITVSKIVGYPGTLFMSLGRDDLDPGAFQIPEVKTIVMREMLKHIKDNRRLEFLSLAGLLSELGVTWPEIDIAKTAWERRR